MNPPARDRSPSALDRALAAQAAARAARGHDRDSGAALDRAGGGSLVDFLSNDVLGLARDPGVALAAARAARDHGAGGRASRLLGGGSPLHARVESEVAAWTGTESALLFPSGYQANLGVLTALAGRGDVIVSDAWNHASLIDGARLSRAHVEVVPHADPDAVAAALAAHRGARRRLVVTESVFSMDGDLAPLTLLLETCRRHDAWLVVDEAHAIGVLGPSGAGALAELDLENDLAARLAARVVTGGKALGGAGAVVAGGAALRHHLVNAARSFVFTTAPPPAVAGAWLAALERVRGATAERAALHARAARLADALGGPPPAAAIVPFVVGAATRALEVEAACRAAGFATGAVRPPSVPEGTARLRLVVHAFNTDAEVDGLAGVLRSRAAVSAAGRRPAKGERAPRPSAAALVVVGTDTGVGKTVVAALLAAAAKARGGVRYWKPVQTGDDDDTAAVQRLAALAPEECAATRHRFAKPASPHEAAAAQGATIDPEELAARFAALHLELPAGARLIVELAGGLLVPLDDRRTQADWLAALAPPLVLVARSGLGTLNHTLLTLEALRARRLAPRALFLVGPRHESNSATLARLAGVAQILEVPPLDPLDPDAIAALARRLDLDGVLRP